MTDLSDTIVAKSDQLNADDLIGQPPLTITITRVTRAKDPDQPISVYYEGDNGKPYKPGKSMRRVLVHIWGKDGDKYVGESMTLYRDPEITFGKLKVGGIRISHMTRLNSTITMALTKTKGAKAAYEVKPLRLERQQQQKALSIEDARAAVKNATSLDDLREAYRTYANQSWWADVQPALDARRVELTPKEETVREEPRDEDHRDDAEAATGAGTDGAAADYDGP